MHLPSCPRCRTALTPTGDDVWSCPTGHRWPVVAGILDCRGEVRGFDTEADRRLAEELHSLDDETFSTLLRRYWATTAIPPALTERYVTGDLVGEARAREVVAQIRAMTGTTLSPGSTVLEIGAGTAALAAALVPHVGQVVVTDISLAWLVLARHRLERTGRTNWTVIAAAADDLPAPANTFDLVIAADVIEHVPDPKAMIDEALRVLRPGASLWLSTPNRWSLTPEPHVRVWGVGFVPRRYAARYVRLVRGVAYDGIETRSLFELRRLAASSGADAAIRAPHIPEAVVATYSRLGRILIGLYHRISRLPLLRTMLLTVTPLFHMTLTKPPSRDGSTRGRPT